MRYLGTINIIGGGISGLTTALALKVLGIKYNLFERNTEITYENVGLGISANIFPILEEWNLLNETKEIGTEIKNFHLVDKRLKYIKSFKLQRPALSVNRKLFYQIVKNRLGEESIFLNSTKAVSDFSEDDIVISADGLYSQTRKKIYPNLKVRNSNQILWRGISKITLDDQFKNSYHDFVGNNLRFAIIQTGENFYSWYAIKERMDNEKVTSDKLSLINLFKDYHSTVLEVIDKSEDIYFSEVLDINPKERRRLKWFKNKVLMIGDAIHLTTPNMANGACLAMEDSYLLANLLSNESLMLQEIFKTFQKQRTKKVNVLVFQSWWLGKLFHQQNKTMERLVQLGMSLTPKFLFDKIYSNVLLETKVDKSTTKTGDLSISQH